MSADSTTMSKSDEMIRERMALLRKMDFSSSFRYSPVSPNEFKNENSDTFLMVVVDFS